MSDLGLVASLVSEVFGFVVSPSGLAKMETKHQLEVIHAAIRIALDKRDNHAVDLLFEQLRHLSSTSEY